jgi:hypothetical protein
MKSMKRSSTRKLAASSKSLVALDSTALARAQGGLVSNFNVVKPASDYNPDIVEANGGPTGMW